MDQPRASQYLGEDNRLAQQLVLQQGGLQELLAAASRNQGLHVMPPSAAPGFPFPDLLAQMAPPQSQSPQLSNLLQQLLGQAASAPALAPPPQPGNAVEAPPATTRSRPTRSSETRATGATTSYASRHQLAEARRRSRINERLEALRKLVPHTEGCNTAVFLEEVVHYVQRLQHRVVSLESKVGLPPSVVLPTVPIQFGDGTPEATAITSSSAGIDRLALQAVLQGAAATVAARPPSVQTNGPGAQSGGLLPTASEELAMAAQLAPTSEGTRGAVMAESQPTGEPWLH